MTFAHPAWLWALLAVPALAFLFMGAERRAAVRLRDFVSQRLLPQLGATVNRFRRGLRFACLLLGLALAVVSLAQPRWGYSYEEVKRKGLDLIMAVDTSRSMLANDVPPNRLQRVKLAGQDLIRELRGDRVGLIAFAGRAFLQAPLTIDYDAAIEALTDLDTNVIPEGGTNISEAITLAVNTFGKSAVGNRALIIFTDGEELAGESAAVAKTAADAGVKIFTVGVGTPEGSLIPLGAQSGGTAFVKDANGEVVKSKLDEKRLREIAESTGGMFLPLANGPATMRQLYTEGLSKMQAAEIDARMSQQPIERYQWPLGGALLALAASMLISERKSTPRRRTKGAGNRPAALAGAALLVSTASFVSAAAPGLDAYRAEHFNEAYEQLQQTLQAHPDTRATDKIQFDAGAAAYKMKDYPKALQSFSQALLSPDPQLQERSHYNLGNTLYQRGETQKSNETKLTDWTNALQHYDQALKIDANDKQAQENSEFVKKKIEELKKQQEQQPSPTPTPSPSPSPNQKDKKDQKQDDKDKDKKKQDQQQQSKPDDQQTDQQQKDSEDKGEGKQGEPKPDQNASPSPSDKQSGSPSPAPSPSAGKDAQPSPSAGDKSGQPSPSPSGSGSPSPSPGEGENNQSPTPSPSDNQGEGSEGNGASPTPAPASTPAKKPSGDVKGAPQDQPEQKADGQLAETEQTEDGQMSEQQAERLLRSMKDEEQRVQLDERKRVRRVYKDW
ncbi:MAG: VWA domain-containing protein [Chthoniobacterales bacterium]